MTKKYGQNNPKIIDYVESLVNDNDPHLAQAQQIAQHRQIPKIQVSPLDGRHLEVIVRSIGAKKCVEIGTLAGYSGICIARALPEDGVLYTFEYESTHAETAEEVFQAVGLSEKIYIFIGPALNNLSQINDKGPFDLVFIDADKESYPQYLQWAEQNLRIGGVVLADNVFAWDHIADQDIDNPNLRASVDGLRQFNSTIFNSKRWRSTILPTGEGLAMAVKMY
ncbi:O-methyltransferase [Candidatus Uabimicrobium amorphum]|uniref:O-methyltransferase n=1 Tax=Uabimicrobium amorphum TaxID=2596890 RepID=A0A5S9IRZ1_UABAM|nr:O-methyltransferase [Candidatus Uabimicrobium amorphum]BBM86627.1 O-methyltransferase [Candidatus Uabimicrobium amorphum]